MTTHAAPTRKAIATITTPNYWPYTAIFLESVRKVFPGWQAHVLCLEPFPEGVVPPDVNLISAEAVWGDQVKDCRERFNLFEWACASKPGLMLHLLETHGAELAVYADSDIEFFAPPACLDRTDAAIVLQPNVSALGETDGREWERLHLQYGTFNGGFFAVRPGPDAVEFLRWWHDRVHRYCCTEPILDVFSDQRWLDLAPGLFGGVAIDRDPACNVAIWNFAGRGLHRGPDGYRVSEGQPLAFFHYHQVRVGMDVDGYVASAGGDGTFAEIIRSYVDRATRHPAPATASTRHDFLDGRPVPPLYYRAVRDTAAELPAGHPDRAARQEARLRILAYHGHHASRLLAPEQDIDRYQRSAWFRLWVDLWYFLQGPSRAGVPVRWVARSAPARALRGALVRIARALRGR